MASLTIKYKDASTKQLFDLVRSYEGKNGEEVLQLLCKAYLSNPSDIKILADTWKGTIKIEDRGYKVW